MRIKLWDERPAPPVVLAWMVAGALVLVLVSVLVWGIVSAVSFLTS